ncbi:hypothetical protein ACFSAV_07615 [Pasteurella oralis]|uniref:Uncharacterized protein n=1 Tax=Pasteurella oralis TaxID=1071947 RepID=A0ABW4NV05_9PAST
MAEQHIIELSNHYQLKATDDFLILYQLKLQDNGTWARVKACATKSPDYLIDTLIRLELQNEEVATLEDIAKTINAMRAELKEAINVGRTQ